MPDDEAGPRPLRVGFDIGLVHRPLGRLVGQLRAAAAAHQRIALIARRREEVGGEVEDRAVVLVEAAQHVHERILRGVRRVVRRAGQTQAVVVDLLRVAVVQRCVRGAATGCGLLEQHTV